MVGAARHSGMSFGPPGWYLAPRFIADPDVTQYRRHFSDTEGYTPARGLSWSGGGGDGSPKLGRFSALIVGVFVSVIADR